MEVEGREVLFGRGCAILYRERPFDWASAVERPVKRLLALAGIYAAYSRKLTQNMRICVRCALILSARLGKKAAPGWTFTAPSPTTRWIR